MPEPSSLWDRIRQARMFQVLLVYLGASWVVLQIADTLTEALSLPAWVMPVAFLLLLVGLVVIMATAWVQSLPGTTQREERGELPTDWQIAPREALASLRRGRLPHLTWGRALAGGVVGMSMLFGGAGIYVGVLRDNLGVRTVSAAEAATGIAVVPFEVRGADLDLWREGMMDLLANTVDGVGGFRSIDTRTVMARWRSVVGNDAPDLDRALRVAQEVGARYAVTGSVVNLGSQVRIVASLHDLDTGTDLGTTNVQGNADDVLRITDELAIGIIRKLIEDDRKAEYASLSTAAITTGGASQKSAHPNIYVPAHSSTAPVYALFAGSVDANNLRSHPTLCSREVWTGGGVP